MLYIELLYIAITVASCKRSWCFPIIMAHHCIVQAKFVLIDYMDLPYFKPSLKSYIWRCPVLLLIIANARDICLKFWLITVFNRLYSQLEELHTKMLHCHYLNLSYNTYCNSGPLLLSKLWVTTHTITQFHSHIITIEICVATHIVTQVHHFYSNLSYDVYYNSSSPPPYKSLATSQNVAKVCRS